MRHIGITTFFILVLTSQVLALTPKQRDTLEKFFSTKGKIVYAAYAPPLGAETGAAIVESGGGHRLISARLAKKGAAELMFEESTTLTESPAPFLLLNQGKHILTYQVRIAGSDGNAPGDLAIRDLTGPVGSEPLFELHGVSGLRFDSSAGADAGAMLWQPARHFLNTGDALPQKFNYFILAADPLDGVYRLRHHLEVLQGSEGDEGVGLNNRAILLYRTGNAGLALEAFDRAAILASHDQSSILRNHQLVSREVTQLAQQSRLGDLPFSEARLAFWQGDFAQCLRDLSGADPNAMPDSDLAMLTLSLAHEKRWQEADVYSQGLSRTQHDFYANCLADIAWIARRQGFREIEARYFKQLEAVDPSHPLLMAGLAALLIEAGERDDAKLLLQAYISGSDSVGRDLGFPFLMLFGLCMDTGDKAGCDRLLQSAATQPLENLDTYVDLVDYTNFALALREVEASPTESLIVPDEPLNSVSFQEGTLME